MEKVHYLIVILMMSYIKAVGLVIFPMVMVRTKYLVIFFMKGFLKMVISIKMEKLLLMTQSLSKVNGMDI